MCVLTCVLCVLTGDIQSSRVCVLTCLSTETQVAPSLRLTGVVACVRADMCLVRADGRCVSLHRNAGCAELALDGSCRVLACVTLKLPKRSVVCVCVTLKLLVRVAFG